MRSCVVLFVVVVATDLMEMEQGAQILVTDAAMTNEIGNMAGNYKLILVIVSYLPASGVCILLADNDIF